VYLTGVKAETGSASLRKPTFQSNLPRSWLLVTSLAAVFLL